MSRRQIYTDDHNDKMVELYKEGASLSSLAKRFSMHPQVVKRKLQKMGCEIRNKSQAMTNYHKIRKQDA